MTISPNGQLYLCKTKLENDYKNQLTFKNKEAQLSYFNSTIQHTFSEYTYIKKDNVIQVGKNIDEIIDCNYLFYKNSLKKNNESIENLNKINIDELNNSKYYFCFITNMEYVNDNCTRITIETDCFQTWLFQIDYKKTFVEREHVNDDTVGLHTIPENLETGEYVCNNKTSLYSGGNTVYVGVATTFVPTELGLNTLLTRYGGIYSGSPILVFDAPYNSVSNFLRGMDALGKADAIVGVFMIPAELIGNATFETRSFEADGQTYTTHVAIPPYTDSETLLNTSGNITAPSSLDGYVPKNNKLKVWPYSYFYVSNNVGSDVEYHFEDFINNTAQFKTIGVLSFGCSIRCIPLNYKKLSDSGSSYNSYNSGITGAKYPICSWQSDAFINWLTENGVNLSLATIGSIGSMIGGLGMIASGGGIPTGLGMIAGGVAGLSSTMAQTYQKSLIPPQAKGNSNAGDVAFSSKAFNLPAYTMTIRNEFAKIIDEYFSAVGYKVNSIKTPNITGRQNWNYVKTINCNFDGDIPQSDLNIIKQMFNNGTTLWHNPATMLDYSQSNNII